MHVIIRERRESRARRAGRMEKKGEKMKRRQSRRGEGECKSNDGTLRGEKKEKKKKKNEERNRASAPADHTRHL